jgi:peptidoglycan/LPS O-acetylase OafA/YrhL
MATQTVSNYTGRVFQEVSDTRDNNFDFIRFVLAALVIWSHIPILRLDSVSHRLELGSAPANALIITGAGAMAVNFFFTISGFLITRSWFNSDRAQDYFKKRFLRIYPGFMASLLFCVLVVGPLGGADLNTYFNNPQTYRFFTPLILGPTSNLPHVFQMPGVIPNQVNSPLWTIRFEVICYLAVALMSMTGILVNRSRTLALFMVSFVLFNIQFRLFNAEDRFVVPFFGNWGEMPRLLTFFLAGCLFYLYRDRIPVSVPLFALSLGLVILFYQGVPGVILPIFGTYTIFFLAFLPSKRIRRFAKSGDYSYGMYLFGFPIQQLVTMYSGYALLTLLPGFANRCLLFVIVFAITYLCAAASWRFIEYPCLKLKRRSPAPMKQRRINPSI